jgi:hypothetical protein
MDTRPFIKVLTRRLVIGLPVAILVGILLFIWSGKRVDRGTPDVGNAPSGTAASGTAPEARADLTSIDLPPAADRSGSGITPGSDSRRSRRAYRFLMEEGRVRLEAVTDLEGDFRIARGGPAWLPGMLCCRLVDEEDRVLAQETLAAPDQTCLVLDPNVPDSSGKPTVAAFRPPGPVVFQVRMPVEVEGRVMKIYRLTGGNVAGLDEEPAGSLIASIRLPE